jgi:DNA-binding Lrp family transcriptional regulator
MQLNQRDEALIRLLETDARLPAVTLAKRLGVSRTTVQTRIDKLIESGVIGGFTIKPGSTYGGVRVHGHVMIKSTPKSARKIEAKLRTMVAVRALHSVSGDFDMIAQVSTATIDELDEAIDEIGMIDGVERTTSSIILSTRISR